MNIIRFLAVLMLLGLLAGCVGTKPAVPEGDVRLPEIDIVMVKENADEALKLAQEARLDVEVVSGRLTEVNNQMLNFSEEMASVSGAKVEEIENRLAVLTEEVKNIYRELDTLRMRIKAPKRSNEPAVFDANVFRPGTKEANAALSPDERKYRTAQAYFNNAKYLNAAVAFKEAFNANPNGAFADNCQFWIGESYFNMGQYARAIANYKKIFAYANTDKADDAQMRIAICYSKLGDNEQAVVEFKNMLNKYPQSEYTEEARKYISQLEQ